jgi:hypothetical protein
MPGPAAVGATERAVEVVAVGRKWQGSGYAIGDDLILTGRDARFDDSRFRVRRPDRDEWRDAELIWADGAIGLLRVAEPYWAGVPARPALLAQPPPTGDVPCLVVGFPGGERAGRGYGPAPQALPGSFSPMPLGPGRVPVDVAAAPRAKGEAGAARWPGLAGAAVLTSDAETVLGVIVAERADSQRLEAAPIWQAMAAGLGELLSPTGPSAARTKSGVAQVKASVEPPDAEPPDIEPPDVEPHEVDSRQTGPPETVPDGRPNDQIEWQSDAPTTRDVLRRDALASAIAERLHRRTAEEPTSFLMLLDGRWGSGKSSVLRMIQRKLADDGWVIVNYDAWRQSRLGASWWTFLSAVRQAVFATLSRPGRAALRVRELWRQRVMRTPVVLAFSLVFAAALGLFLLLRPERLDLSSLGTAVQGVAAVLTALGTLWAGAVVSARYLLWQSRRSARFFEENAENPLNQVAEHMGWLIHRLSRPLLVVIDDIDRCRAEQVVELLESVQTLLRDAPAPGQDRPRDPMAVIVAADAAWLHRAFEREYDGFGAAVAEPGKPLGYLFCDKIFQLVVPMPGLGEVGQAAFLASLLGVSTAQPSTPRDANAVREAARLIDASGSEAEVLTVLSSVEPQVREQVGPQAVDALTRPELVQRTEHSLTRFAPLLPSNPRSMKRFINDYSMARAVRTLEGDPVPVDALAQWTVMRTRWPALAAYLAERPEAAADPAPADGEPPVEDLARLLAGAEVRRVLAFPDGTALTPELIRRCHGVGGAR